MKRIRKYTLLGFIAGVATLPLFYVMSFITMFALQLSGLKSPDQYLSDVLPVDQLEFFALVFIGTLLTTVALYHFVWEDNRVSSKIHMFFSFDSLKVFKIVKWIFLALFGFLYLDTLLGFIGVYFFPALAVEGLAEDPLFVYYPVFLAIPVFIIMFWGVRKFNKRFRPAK